MTIIINETYSQGEWNKFGWHDLFDVSNHIQTAAILGTSYNVVHTRTCYLIILFD